MTQMGRVVLRGAMTVLVASGVWQAATGSDWPMWRHDAQRSGVTAEQLPDELHLQWVRELPVFEPACDYRSVCDGPVAYGVERGRLFGYDVSRARTSLYEKAVDGVTIHPARWDAPALWDPLTLADGGVGSTRVSIKAGDRLYTNVGRLLFAVESPALEARHTGATPKQHHGEMQPLNDPADQWAGLASEILKATGVQEGYALVLGLEQGRLLEERSGCSNSLVAAGGLLNVPCYAVGCVCNYPLQTSFAMFRLPESATWEAVKPLVLKRP